MTLPPTSDASMSTESNNSKHKDTFRKLRIPGYWQPIIMLLLITPMLTELLTNNITFWHFFKPKLFFQLMILVYGPTFLLRELAVRWNLNIAGYIMLGLVYGIYNEGLIAKTLFQVTIANTAFDHYGIVWGINLSWAAIIIVFHAFYAFLFPILIVYHIFPTKAFKPWIPKKWAIGFSITFFLYVSYAFLKNTWPAKPMHYIALITVMVCLIIVSRYFKGGLTFDEKKPRLALLSCCGIVFVATTFTLADIIARSGIHFIFFAAYAIFNLFVAIILLNNKYGIRTLLTFVFASQLGFAISAIIVALSLKSEIKIITSCLFAVIFACALFMTIRRSLGRNVTSKISLREE